MGDKEDTHILCDAEEMGEIDSESGEDEMTPTETIKQDFDAAWNSAYDFTASMFNPYPPDSDAYWGYIGWLLGLNHHQAEIDRLRAENESLRLELGKWREWLAENKVALKQARADALREAAEALQEMADSQGLAAIEKYRTLYIQSELRRMADEVAKNKH